MIDNIYKGELSTTKGNAERTVPLHPVVAKELKKHPRKIHDDHLFLDSQGQPYYNPTHFSDVFSDVRDELGFRYRSPYNARHTSASMMLHAGMSPGKCAEYLGHSVEMFFRKYAKVIEDAQGTKRDENLFMQST